jgi:mannosyl-glycoprotein endo-beta-N-acetylglucosaminidase
MFCQDTCKPIIDLNELLNWSKCNSKRKYKIESLVKSTYDTQNGKSKIILCHDMKNNYQEDRFMQGYNYKNAYRFYEWNLIDTFIYFSHYFVTIPTESWINAAHKNGVVILGTFITEFDRGYKLCKEFINDKNKIDKMIDNLVEITEFYGFDGWLINIENKIDEEFVQNLVYFVDLLTKSLKNKDKKYKVIWYDSVIKTGELKWQNEMNDLNKYNFNLIF